MRRLLILPTAGLLVCLLAAAAGAADRPGAAFLRLGAGARAAGMGEAYTAAANDVTALYWNTAGLAALERKQAVFMHNNWFESINYEYAAYAQPVAGWGTIAGSVAYIDKGTMQRSTYDNKYGAGLGSYGAHDYALTLGWSRMYSRQVAYGGAVKFIRQELDNAGSTDYALDLGVMYYDAMPGLTLGAALANLGSSPQFDSRKEKLPLLLRLGLGYQVPAMPLLLSSDVVFLRSSPTTWRVGLEYTLNEYLALRCGYNTENDAGSGFGGGLGLSYGDFQFNYAYVPFGDLGGTHRIDSVFTFGAPVSATLPSSPVRVHPPTPPQPASQPPLRTPPPPVYAPPPQSTSPTPPAASDWLAVPPLPEASRPAAPTPPALATVSAGEGQLRAAMSSYLEVLRQDPLNYSAYYNIGNITYKLRDFAAARNAFVYALQIKPGSIEAMHNLGGVLYQMGDYAGAARLWEAVLRRDPANESARHNLELLYRKYPEARAAAARPVASVPEALLVPAAAPANATGQRPVPAAMVAKSAEEYLTEGNAQFAAGDHAAAQNSYFRALELQPGSALANFNLATVCYTRRDYRTAAQYFRAATAAAPNDVDAWLYLGMSYNNLGMKSEARAAFNTVLRLQPGHAFARQSLAEISN